MPQIIYGKNAITEVINAGRRKVLEILLHGNKKQPNDPELARFLESKGLSYRLVDRQQLDALTEGARHHGVVARVQDFQYANLEDLIEENPDQALFVICDSINDPQNFGAICRSAYCFGAHAIILAKDRSVDVTSTVVSASAGAVEHLPIIKVTNLVRTLEELKEKGFWCYAADAQAEESLEDMDPSPKSVLILGSEREGIRPLILKKCDFRFSIPMERSFDSLNVAQAASVILYVFSRKTPH